MARTYKHRGKWYMEIRDHRGYRRRFSGFADKAATTAMAARVQAFADRRGAQLDPTPEQSVWVDQLSTLWRDRLVKIGLLDQAAASLTQPLTEHVKAYLRWLADYKGRSRQYTMNRAGELAKLLNGCKFHTWADIDHRIVETWLTGLIVGGQKKRTCNGYAEAIKGFCKYMVREGRATRSPVEHLAGITIDDAKLTGVFTADQVDMLLDYLDDGGAPVVAGLTAPERSLLYRLALNTALRRGSIRSLTAASFAFDRDADGQVIGGTVSVKASNHKNRRPHVVPLVPDLAADLAAAVALKGPGAQAIAMPFHTAKMLREDLIGAGLPLLDADDGQLIFHSFRHTCATWLATAGVPMKSIQAITGHLKMATLTDRYAHLQVEAGREALKSMPRRRRKGVAS